MLKTRIITAIIALLALGVVLFMAPGNVAELVVGALIVAAGWEWSAFLRPHVTIVRVGFVTALTALMAASYLFMPAVATPVLKLAALWWAAAFLWCMFYPTAIPTFVCWLVGALVLVPLFVALIQLYRIGPEILLFALMIVWAADAGAFFAGKRFGRVKLAPSISPGKTWEGVFGGLLVVAVLALVTARLSDTSLAIFIPFCLGVAAMSVVGDLTVSMFKRTAGVKDSGTLFPGHGGVLDRVDSVAAATPLFALGLGWLKLV